MKEKFTKGTIEISDIDHENSGYKALNLISDPKLHRYNHYAFAEFVVRMDDQDEDDPRLLANVYLAAASQKMYAQLKYLQSLISKCTEDGSIPEELFLSNASTAKVLAEARGEKP